MASILEIKHYKVRSLPNKPSPNSVYYVLEQIDGQVKTYITDLNGFPIPLIDETTQGVLTVFGTGVTGTPLHPQVNISTFVSSQLNNQVYLSTTDGKLQVNPITSPDGSLDITPTSTELQIELSAAIVSKINSALQSGDNVSELVNDAGYITQADIPSTKAEFNSQLSDGDFLFVGDITQYTNEQAQDAVGNILVDTATIDLSYNDTGNSITADVKPNSITATELANNINISEFINDADYELKSNKGVINGYASLDAGGKVPVSQLPNSVMEYKGVYNASTNTPTLIDGTGNTGDVYRTSVAGAGVNGLNFVVGDYAVYNGSTWEKSHSGTDNVNSVFGRLGVVVAQNGDYTASQITNTPFGNISSVTVQAALNELDTEKAIDANVVHKTGNESISDGTKTFSNITAIPNIISNISTNTNGIQSINSGAGNGIYSSNLGIGKGIYSLNDSGIGIYSHNPGTGQAIVAKSIGTGSGIISNVATAGTGFAYIGQNNDVNTFTVNKLGDITGNSFIKTGGTSAQFLKADGSVDSTLYTPTSRTLNINGNSFDLSANRTWRTAQADTGVLTFAGLTYNSTTTINIGAVKGVVVDNETNSLIPSYIEINYLGETNKTVTTLGSGIGTIVMLAPDGFGGGTITFQNTFPTSAERKTKIFLGKVGHPTGTITTVINEPDVVLSPLSFARDLFQAFNYINDGVYPYPNGANLTVNITGGNIHGNGINFVNDKTNPNEVTVLPATPVNFIYRTQTGLGGGAITNVDPTVYDNAGTITAIGGGSNNSTLQWWFAVPGSGFIVMYGQTIYPSLLDAIAAIGKESFTVYPNLVNNALLIGVLAVNRLATQLNNTAQARFFNADKLGQIIGAQAGVSTGTLQTAYNNSLVPQITTTTPLGAFTIRRGSALDTDNILVGQNGIGTNTFSVNGNGLLTLAPNTGASQISGMSLINNGTGTSKVLDITNTSSGRGLTVTNTSIGTGALFSNSSSPGNALSVNNTNAGIGILISNTLTGAGITVSNNNTGQGGYFINGSTGIGIYVENQSTGNGTLFNSLTGSTGDLIQFQKNSILQTKFDQNGRYSISGGTAAQYLMADGSTSSLTNPVTGTGASGQVSFWNGTNSQTGSTLFLWDNSSYRLTLGGVASVGKLDIGIGSTTTWDIPTQSAGSVSLGNLSAGSHLPILISKGTTANSALLMMSAVPDDNGVGYDMRFDVRKNDNTEFSTPELTRTAFRFSRFGSILMDITRNGEVLIGTTTNSLSTKLFVNGTGTFRNPTGGVGGTALNLLQVSNGSNASPAVNKISWVRTDLLEAASIDVPDARTNVNGVPMIFTTRDNGGTVTEKMRIANGGNIIISTSDAKLVGGDSVGRFLVGNSTVTSYIEFDGATNTTPNKLNLITTTGTVGLFTNGTEKVTVLNNGNVGIGVTAPTANLHIAASTTAKALMRLTVGSAPTTPNDGDVWLESNTNTGLKIRIAGVTKTISLI